MSNRPTFSTVVTCPECSNEDCVAMVESAPYPTGIYWCSNGHVVLWRSEKKAELIAQV